MAEKGSMNSLLMNEWKRSVWAKRPQGLFKPKSLLVFDSATSHTKKTTLSSFKQHYSTTVAVIPGGMTPLLQPPDVSWNKPFKCRMREKWLKWLSEGEVQYTQQGKRKSASYEMIVEWISESWKEIPEDTIRQSFIVCGIVKTKEGNSYHLRLDAVLSGCAIEEISDSNIEEECSGLTDEDSPLESDNDDKD